jgi:hypothetical protein
MATPRKAYSQAKAALRAYEVLTGSGPKDDGVRDLLADLMHFAKAEGLDFDNELRAAREHFVEERAGR